MQHICMSFCAPPVECVSMPNLSVLSCLEELYHLTLVLSKKSPSSYACVINILIYIKLLTLNSRDSVFSFFSLNVLINLN